MMRPAVVSSYIPALTPVADDFIAICRNSHRIDDCLKTMINFTTESNLFKIFFKSLIVLAFERRTILLLMKKMCMRGYRNLEIFLRGWFDEFGFFVVVVVGRGIPKPIFNRVFFQIKSPIIEMHTVKMAGGRYLYPLLYGWSL